MLTRFSLYLDENYNVSVVFSIIDTGVGSNSSWGKKPK